MWLCQFLFENMSTYYQGSRKKCCKALAPVWLSRLFYYFTHSFQLLYTILTCRQKKKTFIDTEWKLWTNCSLTQPLKAIFYFKKKVSSHANLPRISPANAFLWESQQTKSSGLNLWVGRVLCHLLLLHWIFAASLMKFGQCTCFLSAPNSGTIKDACCLYPLSSLSSSYRTVLPEVPFFVKSEFLLN